MQAFSSHDIFQTLYQQIMLLELKPGSTLRENALCEQFGVSRTPVRSVLQELRIAGLIEVTPYKSTRVTQLDFDTISQQIYLRNAVESAVMTDFAAACTPEQLAQLKTRNDALRRLAAQPHPDPRMFYELDSRLHQIGLGRIVDGVGRGVVLDRDKNYDKVKRAYDALTDGLGAWYS